MKSTFWDLIQPQDYMHTWVISDTHFGHKNIFKFEPQIAEMCGGDIDVHDQMIVDNINRCIGDHPDAIFVHLGDIAFGEGLALKYISKIRAKTKYLVMGNHDTMSAQFYLDCGFTDVMSSFKCRRVLFSHFPISPFELVGTEGGWGNYIGNVHGHIHGHLIPDSRYYNACVEHHQMSPVRLDDILSGFGIAI